ncbi:MAG: biotin--[acetyl-CoA-carboxylase] ligase [Sulfurimonas sp.]|nr:biotin--[acetyl-CoA-carboxylase] ligase [Sulfurimonas sp.]
MIISYLDTLDSSQIYLKKSLQNQSIKAPHAVVCDIQTNGVGSRNNSWQGLKGNLFLSFALPLKSLPSDLKLESASIYFSFIFKEVLNDLDSKVWLKWPNDLYINNLKIGGMITNILDDNLVCGLGVNLVRAPLQFASLDVSISRESLLEKYFKLIEKRLSWKQIFSKYKIEFEANKDFFTHKNSLKISLDKAILQSDGSLIINGERIYSTR